MPLPSNGPLAMSAVNTELGKSSNTQTSLNAADVRALAEKPGNNTTIAFSDLRGKYIELVKVVSTNTRIDLLKSLFTSAEWAADNVKRVIINSNVEVIPAGAYAVAVTDNASGQAGSFGGRLILDNRGTITGNGGGPGAAGQHGLYVNFLGRHNNKLEIHNTGTIRAGGGGGGTGGRGGNGNYSVYVREPQSGGHFSAGYNTYGEYRYYSRGQGGDRNEESEGRIAWYGWIMYNRSSAGSFPGSYSVDGWTYERYGNYTVPREHGYQGTYNTNGIFRHRTDWSNTWGGAGGAGGRGAGYGQSWANGAGGAGGSGANAGAGGAGGRGGDFGAWGTTGARGNNGNLESGQNGSGGAAPGFAIWTPNVAYFTLVNSGLIQGPIGS